MAPTVGTQAMVGRDAELARARQAVDSARAGEGGVLLVTGEAGIGKSRLLAELAAVACAAGCTVLSGHAVPGGGTYRAVAEAVAGHLRQARLEESAALRPFRAALSRLAPGWVGEPTTAEGAPDPVVMLGEGLLRLLVAAGGSSGCVLLLEDLHWADADTVALVGYLARAVRSSPVLIAVSARDDQGATPIIDELAGVTRLRLNRLDDHAVALLATGCASGAELPAEILEVLLAKAEGLPVLVEELLGGLLAAGVRAAAPARPRPAAGRRTAGWRDGRAARARLSRTGGLLGAVGGAAGGRRR